MAQTNVTLERKCERKNEVEKKTTIKKINYVFLYMTR